jgi:hypothetical protein
MRWIFDNLEIAAAIVAALVYWLNQRKATGGDRTDSPFDNEQDTGADPDATRRLQEEIRRKIAERRAGGGPPPMPEATGDEAAGRPVVVTMPQPQSRMPNPFEATLREAQSRFDKAEKDRKRRLAVERERQEEAAREESRRRLEEVWRNRQLPTALPGRAGQLAGRSALLENLRGSAALRRAVVEIEVLGPPISLRREAPGGGSIF